LRSMYRLCKEIKPHLVITEIENPATYEQCKSMQQDKETAHIPILVHTIKPTKKTIVDAVQSGMQSFVLKPASIDSFLSKAEVALGKTQVVREKKTSVVKEKMDSEKSPR